MFDYQEDEENNDNLVYMTRVTDKVVHVPDVAVEENVDEIRIHNPINQEVVHVPERQVQQPINREVRGLQDLDLPILRGRTREDAIQTRSHVGDRMQNLIMLSMGTTSDRTAAKVSKTFKTHL